MDTLRLEAAPQIAVHARCGIAILCSDGFAATGRSIARFITATYATSEAVCWEAALQLAEEAGDIDRGPLLVARIATLVRIIRRSRMHELDFLPVSCNRLTIGDERLMLLIDAARHNDQPEMVRITVTLAKGVPDTETLHATMLIADVSWQPEMAHLQLLTPSLATPISHRPLTSSKIPS